MIITILGWIMAVLITLLLVWAAYCEIRSFIFNKIENIKIKGIKEFAYRYRSGADWLNSKERKPYAELYIYIMDCMYKGQHINAEFLRKKVDEINEGYN